MSTATTFDLPELEAARSRAIELSGWGAGVRFVQPRNLAFWVWAALVLWGAVTMVQVFSAPVAYYTPAMSVSFVVFGLYGLLLWWFTQHIDRYASQPGLLRVMALLWGGFAATWVIALPANTALFGIYTKWFGQQFQLSWGAAFAAPLTEEWGKGIGLLLLIAIAPHVVRTAFDGFILGAFLGLGFQTFENVYYSMNAASSRFGSDPLEASSLVLLIRTTSGVGGHILFSALFGAGLVFLLGRPGQARRAGLGALLILTAMGLHFVFDAGAAISELIAGPGTLAELLTFGSMAGTPLLALLVLWRVFPLAVRGERALMQDMLAPEVARGVVTDEEAAAAAGDRKARRRFRASGRGLGHRHHNHHVLEAVFDLARELGRARGADTERVEHARAEVGRIREGSSPPAEDPA